jgi:hypothetical protein
MSGVVGCGGRQSIGFEPPGAVLLRAYQANHLRSAVITVIRARAEGGRMDHRGSRRVRGQLMFRPTTGYNWRPAAAADPAR